ncbi:MAG: dTDP-4-dehydrorhamnose 3,5-epimerase [Clostridia bacterium]|nr:dTDP-4-dehydrorhamnose 3,5-epimerase [Clostridia bacterium]
MESVTKGNFTFIKTEIDGVIIVEPKVFGDNRGYFMETYVEKHFKDGGIPADFVQDNQSSSTYGVLRGLHFQREHTQAKLVRVVKGEVYDVAVDLRKDSPTFGKYVGVLLSAENKRQFFVPKYFAHGFLVLSDEAEFVYKVDDYYAPGSEVGLMWDDPTVGIDWPIPEGMEVKLSEKDTKNPPLTEIEW